MAVILPCHNEAVTIGQVVHALRAAMPDAGIYVFDKNSTDDTAEIARAAGAIVRHEALQRKGFVVRRMFRDIKADLYLIADGDGSHEASLAPAMVELARSGPYDLVKCVRRDSEVAAYRGGHRLGNRLLTGVVQLIFGDRVRICSGVTK
jgi:glycosyltransferase involved in cell wall biosynthesis